MPDEFQNMNVKECLHQALRSLMEEVLQTHETHHKKNYLARVNKWYNSKIALIDDKLLKKPIPPRDISAPLTQKALKKQLTIKRKQEEIEKDDSPVKKIKLDKNSPLNKTRFPPIAKVETSYETGGESPYRKFYEDASLNKRKGKATEENFTKKIISLKQTPFTEYDAPYKENLLLANRRGLELWKNHREKKIILNRSQEQLQKSVTKWGHKKSHHHERALMVADRHSIVYNDHSRSWKVKPKQNKKEELSNSLFISHDKFLETDDEALSSSDEDEQSKEKTRNKDRNDYSFNDETNMSSLMNKLHDMTYMTTDHDVMFNSSMSKQATGDDSFFLTKKNIDGDASPTKKGAATAGTDAINNNTTINPLRNLNRIQKLRHMKGNLIGGNKVPEAEQIDTIFNTETSLKRHISLSLYSRPQSLFDKRTLPNDYEDTTFGSISLRKMPQMRNGSVEPYQSNHSEQRTQQIEEIETLKHQLTGQDVNCSVMTIQKAILFPEDRPDEQRSYPKIEDLLFHDPFGKVKKKKKKKGKKKKK